MNELGSIRHGDTDYQHVLIRFNSTDKYRDEMSFLSKLIDPVADDVILDYGCGIGTMVCHLQESSSAKVFGFDVIQYMKSRPNWFKERFWFEFNKVYFMHSLAHIPDVMNKLIELKENILQPGGKIYVLTPNKRWLDVMRNENYKPDPTVVSHYDQVTLPGIFQEAGYRIDKIGQIGDEKEGQQERIYIVASL